jgi:PPK2 family polyphosphate:nucleotide phosphotransferase
MASIRDRLRVEGAVSLARIDTTATPGDPGGKEAAKEAGAKITEEISDLQERLWAQHAVNDSRQRVLFVLQGMDASGKGGVVSGVFAGANPRWLRITGFGKPTPEELAHHFLWRIRRALPLAGEIGVFDRSHYEDVVAVRARKVFGEEVWRPRFDEINAFEQSLADEGCTVVKVFLHISREYQLERQLRRLERPDKRWKFNEGDLEDRKAWPAFEQAYEEVLERCPGWHVVPADHKWYRIWAVSEIVRETLRDLELEYPERSDLDIAELKRKLLKS